jgi:hypothetical protein
VFAQTVFAAQGYIAGCRSTSIPSECIRWKTLKSYAAVFKINFRDFRPAMHCTVTFRCLGPNTQPCRCSVVRLIRKPWHRDALSPKV